MIIGYALLLASALASGPGPICSRYSISAGMIQWSDKKVLVSPDRRLFMEVKPRFDSEENETPVFLGACGSKERLRFFTLTRSADVRWDSNSRQIVIVDHPTADWYKVLVFSVLKDPYNPELVLRSGVDEALRASIKSRLPKIAKIIFYRPKPLAWRGGPLVLSLSGSYIEGEVGSMKPYCYLASLNSNTMALQKLSADENGCDH